MCLVDSKKIVKIKIKNKKINSVIEGHAPADTLAPRTLSRADAVGFHYPMGGA